ncbi:uncharacterized protein PHACADRAFT_211610 [Phanerochaete carnosa HHB-10118-sp]|uniref:Major facilitator superfamily (MFS) profile domain-containing protein n=1 Tax=Phanerochaete carnosa (strain HHB-10118-sp) TaxID=650164 RepID=K5VZV6_PHACS|nr:uncharacterized protein PHACADRAFT_211610 [Phanerochaete carnosa HHB-10118-sp]EKM52340.1 hypothetical protein PHACADRAFT_211610 [Phanerochaete carnosa HHB-10118-sp]
MPAVVDAEEQEKGVPVQPFGNEVEGNTVLAYILGHLHFALSTTVSTALPIIVHDLNGADFVWVASAYALAATTLLSVTDGMSQVFGRQPCMLLSLALFTLGSALCGSAKTMNWLIAARTLQGAGGGSILAISAIVISDLVPLAEGAVYNGFIGISNVLVIGSSTAMVLALTWGGVQHLWSSAQILVPLVIGLLGLLLFLLYEAKVVKHPLVWRVTICMAVLQTQLTKWLLTEFVSSLPEGVSIVYSTIPIIPGLSKPLHTQVRAAFADSICILWQVSIGIGGIGALVSLFMKGLLLHKQVDKKWGIEENTSQEWADEEKSQVTALEIESTLSQ